MDFKPARSGGMAMDALAAAGVLVLWIILQAWVLPRLGVRT